MKLFPKLIVVALSLAGLSAQAAELRVLAHSSFSVDKPLLAAFEKQTGAKVSIIKAGDAGEMVNKLILTKGSPIADVVFGLDNSLIGKAEQAGALAPLPAELARGGKVSLPGAAAVDYGYVTLNYDKAWFAKSKLPLPKTLNDLTQPAYKNLLVVENPATSSPGLAFLSATIHALGEDKAFALWGKLRDNGLKVSKGWTEAYYTDFSKNGGSRPIVVSYAASPAAEVFYSKDKPVEAPTANLLLPGSVFRQVEGAALVKGGKEPKLAQQFIAFLRSDAVQKDIPTRMWMYPAMDNIPLDPVYKHAEQPAAHDTPDSATLAAKQRAWVGRWTRVVLKSGQ
ncbi:thiamine ABC transporter substrate binding subunit [Chromobacterium piscinae]|uniref:Thiamine ABC transporter substrate-binding protein n=1 Tax=Chromobacterium piscinae TaxID=686831 RepID=A0ABV0H9R1_9NEIS|nr:thiamine ABC transporter substrate-binding protein [Chromobacterium piscinae]MBX9296908.1 thiamine ABC transporter substrate-binding protein [Chromobacterium vaccinii]MBX9357467.1 thiamine ABC transporter substrate-binding protein [Chromobacterium vaccinii]MCD4505580.1 thiamine ABC transporter substrate-binding protein [Chromobacterium piscinae]MCD5329996.1 thiamine ABC transporter substrate-binding protein [Chromobacterium piscinae]NHQ84458.1 thiamine ABC transporter substrate-binding prot